jgi:hypothetical protein
MSGSEREPQCRLACSSSSSSLESQHKLGKQAAKPALFESAEDSQHKLGERADKPAPSLHKLGERADKPAPFKKLEKPGSSTASSTTPSDFCVPSLSRLSEI